MLREVLAEASIHSINTRKIMKASTWLTNLHLLPTNHPLSQLDLKTRKRFKSPLQRIRATNVTSEHQITEKIKPYIMAPWEPRIKYIKADAKSIETDIYVTLKPGEVRIVSIAVKQSGLIGFRISLSSYQFSVSAGIGVGSIRC